MPAMMIGPSMVDSTARPPIAAEVLVAGAGIVGLVVAIGLARHGIDVVLAGRIDARAPGRTVALLNGSIAFLDDIGLWRDLEPLSEPLRVMRIVDDTGALFRAPTVSFRAQDLGEAWFGRNIGNAETVETLARLARSEPRLTLIEQHLVGFDVTERAVAACGEHGAVVSTHLLIAADGRRSPARQAAGVPIKTWRYSQTAITAILRHARPHRGVSTEFHTRQGPFTLVPLPALPDAAHRSSLVWVMDPERANELREAAPERLAGEIERRSRGTLGAVTLESETGSFPITGQISDSMIAPRMALAGEAAHVLPPIAAQGLNLGLRDAAALVRLCRDAKRQGADLGGAALLGRYERERRGDVALRTMGVDRLNRSLLSGFGPGDLLRGAGLTALAHVGPLRRLAMRAGLGAPG